MYNIEKEVFNPLIHSHLDLFPMSQAKLSGPSKFAPDTLYFISGIFAPEHNSGGYIDNDPFHISLMIERTGENEYTATLSHGGTLLINPRPEERHLAYSIVKCSMRKTKGSAEKVIKAVQAWQQKCRAVVLEHHSEIRGFANSNLKHLINEVDHA